jgi:hypothetical protein
MEKDKLPKILEDYVVFDNSGEMRFKWKEIEEKKEFRSAERNEILDILKDIGILSLNKKGNYGLIGSGGNLNPMVRDKKNFRVSDYTFFTRETDAIDYKYKVYSDAHYSVDLVKYLD